jgi:hypothetical protein
MARCLDALQTLVTPPCPPLRKGGKGNGERPYLPPLAKGGSGGWSLGEAFARTRPEWKPRYFANSACGWVV